MAVDMISLGLIICTVTLTAMCYVYNKPTRVVVAGQSPAVRPLVVALHLVVTEADPPTALVGNWARHNTSIISQEIVD